MSAKPNYLLVGSGRLARHMERYFQTEGLAFRRWSRKDGTRLEDAARPCTHVWILISDGQIQDFISENARALSARKLLHASGALTIEGADSVHPLASFTEAPLSVEFYRSVPFVTETGREPFGSVFPDLKNPSAATSSKDRAYYHALCVSAGNFTSLLWNETAKRFESRLKLEPEILLPYLESIVRGIQANPKDSLTGPLARGDVKTIEANLAALKGDPLEGIYRAFLKLNGLG
ncbi:MAG: DUF2520 domain-containing protein [Bdellovibrionia bacterium]